MSALRILELAATLDSLAEFPQRGTFFRSIDLARIDDPLSALGSMKQGGRYNKRGKFEALYVSDTQITALHEVQSVYTNIKKIVAVRQPPRAMLSIDLEVTRVIDLRSRLSLDALKMTADDLKQPWKIAQDQGRRIHTQDIGEAARHAEIEGLLVPSARVSDGTNLVVFLDRLRIRSTVTLYRGDNPALPGIRIIGQFKPSVS